MTIERTGGIQHLAVGIDWYEDAIKSLPDDTDWAIYGSYAGESSREALLTGLKDLRKRGYRYVPTCDNTDSTGRCTGCTLN